MPSVRHVLLLSGSCCMLALLLAVHFSEAHECAHDHLKHDQSIVSEVSYQDHPFERTAAPQSTHTEHLRALDGEGGAALPARRRTATTTWANIRIKLHYGDMSDATAAQQAYLKDTILPPVTARLESMLQVVPVSGNLFAKRDCKARVLPSGNCAEFADPTRCGSRTDTHFTAIPEAWFAEEQECSGNLITSCTTKPAGTGVPDTDYVVFVSSFVDDDNVCSSSHTLGTQAFAAWCVQDQHNRPTFGYINVCPATIVTDGNHEKRLNSLILHEIIHALGFSARSWPLFRDEEGNPRTARDSYGDPDEKLTVSCSPQNAEPFKAADTTLKHFAERGMNDCGDGSDPRKCVTKMVTPRVEAAAQLYFGCDTLQGAELENQPTTPCVAYGSHWEQRLFMDSVMSSTMGHNPKLNPITLAMFEDSGWYKSNYSAAGKFRPGAEWGFQQGCDFALNKCAAPGNPPTPLPTNPPHFCDGTSTARTCSTSREAIAACSVATFSSVPSQFQYFTNNANKGGILAQADYCPYYKGLSSGYCDLSSNQPTTNYAGELYSDNSLCFDSTLDRVINGKHVVNPQAACYKVKCMSTSLLKVTITLADGSESTVDCTSGTQKHTFGDYDGELTCLDPSKFCSQPISVDVDRETAFLALSPTVLNLFDDASDLTKVSVHVVRALGKRNVTVDWATRAGTAKAGTDFMTSSGTLSWDATDVSSRTIVVPITSGVEFKNQLFYIDLSNPVNATIGSGSGSAAITLKPAPEEPTDNAAMQHSPALLNAIGVALVVIAMVSSWVL